MTDSNRNGTPRKWFSN